MPSVQNLAREKDLLLDQSRQQLRTADYLDYFVWAKTAMTSCFSSLYNLKSQFYFLVA